MLAVLTTAVALAGVGNTTSDMSGHGYSTDTQQVSQEACYAATRGTVTGAESHIALQEAMSFTELQNSVKRSIGVGFRVGVFDVGAEAGYLRSVMDTDYSLSLNYFQYSSATVNAQMVGTGAAALTAFGQQMYQGGKNEYFRVVCGDNYLTSYKEGAMLLLGINVVLRDREQRSVFSGSLTAGVQDIASATLAVQKIADEQQLTGHVVMGAYQVGGNPNDLTKILAKDASGGYFVLSCAFNNMTACHAAANGLLTYAATDFPTQFDFGSGQGMTFLGEGFYTYEPAEYVGLTMPKTLVTPAVTSARQSLAEKLREAQYYVQNFYPLYMSYPVAWNGASALYASVKAGYADSVANVGAILNYVTPQDGAMGCFDTPDQCVALAKKITASLADVTAAVKAVEQVRWMLPFGAAPDNNMAMFMWNGAQQMVVVLPTAPNGNTFTSMGPYKMTPTTLTYQTYYKAGKDDRLVNFAGNSTDNGATYIGQACHGTPGKSLDDCYPALNLTHVQSPYYFSAYTQ